MMPEPQNQSFIPRGTLLYDEPMSRHTSWRVGGPADIYFIPADRDDLVNFFRYRVRDDKPITWLGLGSNVLVRDGGIRGTVIATHKCLSAMDLQSDYTVYAEAGVPCAKIARMSARHGIGGAEFFAGIPGTLGGALAMNAGAFGKETWNVVVAVETLNSYGEIYSRKRDEFTIRYRHVDLPVDEWFLSARMTLEPGNTESSMQRIKELLATRAQTQPIQMANAGSVFMNPDSDHAARLIETAGLKGVNRGGASVSEKHANFIVHRGNTSAADIEALIAHVQEEVERVHGVRLHREVRILGESL